MVTLNSLKEGAKFSIRTKKARYGSFNVLALMITCAIIIMLLPLSTVFYDDHTEIDRGWTKNNFDGVNILPPGTRNRDDSITYPTNISALSSQTNPNLIIIFPIVRSASATLEYMLETYDNERITRDGYIYLNKLCKDKFSEEIDKSIYQDERFGDKTFLDKTIFMNCLDQIPRGKSAILLTMPVSCAECMLINEDLLRDLSQKGWNIISSVTYRRFFLWLPSYMYYFFRFLVEKQDWKHILYSPLEGFAGFLDDMQRAGSSYIRDWGHPADEIHPTQAVAYRLNKSFGNVSVFNIHSRQENLMASFYCDFMVMNESCTFRKRIGTSIHAEKAVGYDDLLLAVAAYNEGILNDALSLENVKIAIKIHRYKVENESKYFRKCLSKDQERWLLESSIKYESLIFGHVNNETLHEHRAAFRTASVEKNFCTVDATRMVEDESWERVWASHLRSRTKRNYKDMK